MNNEKEPNDIVDAVLFYRRIWKSIPFLMRGCIVAVSISWAITSIYAGDFSSRDWDQQTRGVFLFILTVVVWFYCLLASATEDSL